MTIHSAFSAPMRTAFKVPPSSTSTDSIGFEVVLLTVCKKSWVDLGSYPTRSSE